MSSGLSQRQARFQGWAEAALKDLPGWIVEVTQGGGVWECYVLSPEGDDTWRDLEPSATASEVHFTVSSLVEELKNIAEKG